MAPEEPKSTSSAGAGADPAPAPSGPDPDELVPLGVVIKPHGIKGDVRVHAFHPKSPLWDGPRHVVLLHEGQERRIKVKKISRAAKFLIFVLEGVNTREGSEALRGHEVCLRRSELPPPDPDEFYLRDLVGLLVFQDLGEGEPEEVGEVEEVYEYPAATCVKVVCEDGIREVPLQEPWTLAIDVEEGVLVVGAWDDLPVIDG